MTTQLSTVHRTDYTRWGLVVLAAIVLFTIPEAHADLQGGINKAKSYTTMIRDGVFSIAAVFAGLYLLWKVLQAMQGRADWGEVGMACVHVAVAGGAIALAGWLWTSLTS